MSFKAINEFEGVYVDQIESNTDFRGTFLKFSPGKFGFPAIDSIALSMNPKIGTLRGMHYQIEPFAEEKIVTCVRGAIYDAIIDMRPDSKSFGEVGVLNLSQENGLQIYLPKGIAHGFQTLQPDTIVHYFLSSPFSAKHSYSIDPFEDNKINWPIETFHLAEKDKSGIPFMSAAKSYSDSLNKEV